MLIYSFPKDSQRNVARQQTHRDLPRCPVGGGRIRWGDLQALFHCLIGKYHTAGIGQHPSHAAVTIGATPDNHFGGAADATSPSVQRIQELEHEAV
jgi:hypothetical protein